MKRIILVALASLSLAACQNGSTLTPNGNASTPPAEASNGSVATGACELSTTAMYAAEAAYNAPAAAYVSADGRGLLTAPVKAKVKPILTEAYEWLKKARLFYSSRDTVGFCGSTASLKSLASQASALLPSN